MTASGCMENIKHPPKLAQKLYGVNEYICKSCPAFNTGQLSIELQLIYIKFDTGLNVTYPYFEVFVFSRLIRTNAPAAITNDRPINEANKAAKLARPV